MRNFVTILIAIIVIFLIIIAIYANGIFGDKKEEITAQSIEDLETSFQTIIPAKETTAPETTVEKKIASATTNAAETVAETVKEEIPDGMPTLKLTISEGPVVLGDDICYYRIEARVTGNPYPFISFSKDDSNGAWGENIAQVNLKKGEIYNLIVTATNSVGKITRNKELSWSQ